MRYEIHLYDVSVMFVENKHETCNEIVYNYERMRMWSKLHEN